MPGSILKEMYEKHKENIYAIKIKEIREALYPIRDKINNNISEWKEHVLDTESNKYKPKYYAKFLAEKLAEKNRAT